MSEISREQRAVDALSAYVDLLLDDRSVDEMNASENKRRAFFAFVFGGIGGLAIKDDLTPQEAQAVAIRLYGETLRMAPGDCMRMVQLGIDAAAGDSIWSEASSEGLEEFFAWQDNPDTFSASRLRAVLDRVPAENS
jgi:hypothetical protein